MGIINFAKFYNEKPSKSLGIKDEYTAYCFDEACAFISLNISNNKVPSFNVESNDLIDFLKKF